MWQKLADTVMSWWINVVNSGCACGTFDLLTLPIFFLFPPSVWFVHTDTSTYRQRLQYVCADMVKTQTVLWGQAASIRPKSHAPSFFFFKHYFCVISASLDWKLSQIFMQQGQVKTYKWGTATKIAPFVLFEVTQFDELLSVLVMSPFRTSCTAVFGKSTEV